MSRKQAFISLKDHKENFLNNPKCRLINPAKSDLGFVSKTILDRINNSIRSKANVNQWRNTQSVVEWFSNIKEKSSCSFLVFDIVDYYPSISESLLIESLAYAKQFTSISEDDVQIIMHARKSLLFDCEEPWVKKGDSPMFDVAMGSYDGAEICELVGLFILHRLNAAYSNGNIGLYRDDGLAVFKSTNARALDKTRKDFAKCFAELGLKITAQSNLKVVNYLDVTLDLSTGKYYPYRKPDNNPLYINVNSNHPPSIIKQLPKSISTRISSLSCNSEEFNKASTIYNDALKSSGYKEGISYTKSRGQNVGKGKNRPRSIIWFNPPYSADIETNVAKTFLKLIDKHFPKLHILHKVFNRNNVKVSYSCTSNMRNLIKQHNAKILNETRKANSDGCNCRKRNSCPLDGACLASGIVYKATVTTNIGQPKIYIGSTEHSFKTRFNNHKISLKYRKHSHSTCLSKYIWELKDKGTDHEIKWSILKRAKPYSGKPSRCNLCLAEKLCILTADKSVLLNKRSELITKCRHENKFYAANQKPDRYDYPP